MNIFYVLMPLLFLFTFQDITKNVRSSGQDTSVIVTDMDSCDFRMDTAYAGHLYREAKVLMDSGEYDLALEMLEDAETIYLATVGEMDSLTANIYHLQGVAFRKKRNLESSLDFSERALQIRLKVFGERHPTTASTYNNLGAVWKTKGDYNKAIMYYNKVLVINLETLGESHPDVARTYINLGIVCYNKGDYDQSIAYCNKALAIRLKIFGDSHPDVASIHNKLGVLAKEKGNLNQAVLYHMKALAIEIDTFGEKHPQVARSYNNLGVVWIMKGDYDQSKMYYEKALAIKIDTFGENHRSVAPVYNNIGNIWQFTGDYDQAILYHEKALGINVAAYGELHPSVSKNYTNLGVDWTNKENYDKAELNYSRALAIDKVISGEHHPQTALDYLNMGVISEKKMEYEMAIFYYDKALSTYKKALGEEHPGVAAAYSSLGYVWRKEGNYEKASSFHQRALSIRREFLGDKHPLVAETYKNLVIAWMDKGNYDQAKQDIQKAEASLRYNFRIPNRFENVNDLLVLKEHLFSVNAYYQELYKHSQDLLYKDSIMLNYEEMLALQEHLQKNFSSASTKQFYVNKARPVYEGAIDNLIERDKIEELPETFQIAEKLKGRQLSEKMKDASFSSSYGIPDSLKEQEYDLGVDIAFYEKKKFKEEYERQEKNDSLVSIYDDKVFELNRQREDLQELLKKDYSNYYNARYSQKVISALGVQDSLLRPNQALLEYFVGDSSIFTFTILPDTFFIHQIKKDFPLDTWVEDMLHGIYDPYTPGADTLDREYSFQQAASLIYQKVFHHVDTLLPEGTDIILVPDGILGYIPFDILLSDSTDFESYLIKDYQISYAYSATLQAEMEKMEHDHQAQKKILAFAPSFDHAETTGDTNVLASRFIDVSNSRNWLGRLKYNDDEVRSISQMVPTDVFMDSTATKDQFLQNAGDYSIIHLSTHGKANDKMGDYSFLAFYDPQDSSETWLYNRELYGLDLNADMVVLSACETGIGELQRGEGIISLARGFSYAGAKSIITTLWSVNDRSTQKVMELFYAHLADGMPKDAALRQAKLDYLNQYPHLGKSPYFWAGIIPIGDMSPISFQARWYQNPWIWLGALLLLTLGFWAFRKLF